MRTRDIERGASTRAVCRTRIARAGREKVSKNDKIARRRRRTRRRIT